MNNIIKTHITPKNTSTTELYREVDEDFNNGEWPYPTEYITYAVAGELAERIQRRFGTDAPVTIKETRVSGGYSEYTQEIEVTFEVSAGGQSKKFEGGYYIDDLFDRAYTVVYTRFNNWLNEDV